TSRRRCERPMLPGPSLPGCAIASRNSTTSLELDAGRVDESEAPTHRPLAACFAARVMSGAMLDAALEYARRGVAIFPVWGIDRDRCGCRAFDCTSPGKHPVASCAPHGFKEATTDEATIRAWWTRFPNANIATPTGVWCDVVDVDPRNGGDTTLL